MPFKNFLRLPSRKSRPQRQANQQAQTPATATPSIAPPKPRMEARSAGGLFRLPIPPQSTPLQRRNSTPGRAQGAPSQPRPQLQRRNSTPGMLLKKDPLPNVSDLNIGAGNNPMASKICRDTTNIDMSPPPSPKLQSPKEKGALPKVNYRAGDAMNLPFGSKKFDRIHAINPFGFNPVNQSVAGAVNDVGAIFVSGTRNNKFATNEKPRKNKEPKPMVDPASVGLQFVKEKLSEGKPILSTRHQFGKQTKSDGTHLNTDNSFTKVYRKRQPFDK